MLRIIAGIIVGFIVMAVGVMATFGIAMLALGWEGTYQPDSWWTTDTFNIIVLIGGFIAAIVGGVVCGLIARNSKAAFAFAAIVLAFGIGGAIMNMNKPDPPARTEPVMTQGIMAAMKAMMEHGKEPTWFAFSKVVLGAVGVLLGAAMVRPRPPGGTH